MNAWPITPPLEDRTRSHASTHCPRHTQSYLPFTHKPAHSPHTDSRRPMGIPSHIKEAICTSHTPLQHSLHHATWHTTTTGSTSQLILAGCTPHNPVPAPAMPRSSGSISSVSIIELQHLRPCCRLAESEPTFNHMSKRLLCITNA